MSKELKLELFNIYDLMIFEDENGITEDCVCAIGKEKEVDRLVDKIECINHNISIYEDGNYKVWKSDGKDRPYYATNKKIIHLYTLKNDNRYYEIYPTDDYVIPENTRAFGKDIINLNKTLKQAIDKPILYASRYGNKYIVPQKIFEEQGKTLNIIFKKKVDIVYLEDSNTVEEYNSHFGCVICKLTKEEFDLLKRWIN